MNKTNSGSFFSLFASLMSLKMAHCYSNSGSVAIEEQICDPQANVFEQIMNWLLF